MTRRSYVRQSDGVVFNEYPEPKPNCRVRHIMSATGEDDHVEWTKTINNGETAVYTSLDHINTYTLN